MAGPVAQGPLRHVSEEGEEPARGSPTSRAQEGALSSAAAVAMAATEAVTTARVSANLEAARADALARTNAYLRGLLDSLVEGAAAGPCGDGGGRSESNPIAAAAAAPTPEGTDEVCIGDDDGTNGEVEADGRHQHGSAERLDHHRRRRRGGDVRGNTTTFAGRFNGDQQQQQQHRQLHGGPLLDQGGAGAEERISGSPSSSSPSSGLSRALRALVDALQERDVQIQVLEDDRGPVRDGGEGGATAAEAIALRAEVRKREPSRRGAP